MIVVYEGNDEVLVCTLEAEHKLIADYFSNPNDRNIEEYDRTLSPENVIAVRSTGLRVD